MLLLTDLYMTTTVEIYTYNKMVMKAQSGKQEQDLVEVALILQEQFLKMARPWTASI